MSTTTDDALAVSEFFANLFIDPNTLPDDGYGSFQLIFLLLVYGLIIIFSSLLMATGSELLIFIPAISGIVGSVIIPIIAQTIDAFIIIFSCIGANAQNELKIGVGALAGATIAILNIGFFIAIINGRVDLFEKTGMPNYFGSPKLSPSNTWNFQGTGILIHKFPKVAASLMVLSSLSYVIIIFPNIVYASDRTKTIAFEDRNFALSTFIICFFMFAYYVYYQVMVSRQEDNANNLLRDELLRTAVKKKIVSLLAIMTKDLELDTKKGLVEPLQDDFENGNNNSSSSKSNKGAETSRGSSFSHGLGSSSTSPDETDTLIHQSQAKKRLAILLRPFFDKYDTLMTGSIPLYNLHGLFIDIGELPPHHTVIDIFVKHEKDGVITFQGVVDGLFEFLAHHDEIVLTIAKGISMAQNDVESNERRQQHEQHKAELFEEISEFPTDVLELSPSEQRSTILIRGLLYILSGLFLALFFSSPLIDVIDALGTRIGVSSFYISFVLSPIFADLYSFILTYRYAQRRTSKSITLALVSLLGCIIINNTMVLGVFMIIIYFEDLAWVFLSETIIIIVTELYIGLMCVKNVHTLLDAVFIILWYPTSIAIVYVMNTYGGF